MTRITIDRQAQLLVSAAASLFDEKIPDWYDRVDLTTLDMWAPSFCILGQITGWYYGEAAEPYKEASRAIQAQIREAYEFNAFDAWGDPYVENSEYFDALIVHWTAAVESRRQTQPTS